MLGGRVELDGGDSDGEMGSGVFNDVIGEIFIQLVA